ncbi:MAG: ribbon-helix-helix domain-containing protein [Thermoanaerobaculaceae bacterium]|jgi:hypothetical protein|nr:ribbon-helix-helix domain-containing protein [Thermoanaerobaculaceae bacterium]
MKTAISVPDSIFREAERFAREARKSRSQLFSEAVAEYLARHTPDAVTEAMNLVCERLDGPDDQLAALAALETLRRAEW